MSASNMDEKTQNDTNIKDEYDSSDSSSDQDQDCIVSGNDGRRKIDVFKPKINDIYGCIGQLDVEFSYPHNKFTERSTATGTVILLINQQIDENKANDEKEENKQQAFILTCAHSVRLNVMICDECNTYRLRRKNGIRTTCIGCGQKKGSSQKQITIQATKITFRDRSIEFGVNYGKTVENYDCKEHCVCENYDSFPKPNGGLDWAILRFIDSGQYKAKMKNIHIDLINSINVFEHETKREFGIFGYPHDTDNKLVGMKSDRINQFQIKTNETIKTKYLQQEAIDTIKGESGALIWFKEKDTIKICGIHCGGRQSMSAFNIATLINDTIIREFDQIKNGWRRKVKFLNKNESIIIVGKTKLDLFKQMFWEQLIINKSNNITLKLLYRSNEQDHNKDAYAFHTACDGISNTVTIIQNYEQHIFGGYTTVPWKSKENNNWKTDQSAFLYCLRRSFDTNDQFRVYCNTMNGRKAVARNKKFGPCFGYDLIIKGSKSFCQSKQVYDIDVNEFCGGAQQSNKQDFRYSHYEVYAIQIE
eukprot:450982_1